MKVSVSLPPADVVFLDDYVHDRGGKSRSAAVHEAIGLLRRDALEDEYAQAWADWDIADGDVWDAVASDGVGDAAR